MMMEAFVTQKTWKRVFFVLNMQKLLMRDSINVEKMFSKTT
jgi:hypothetical protein